MYLVLSVVDLLILFILSRFITRALSRLIHSKIKRLHATVRVFSFLLFPGTLLHELSHYILAHVLGVRIFDFILLPKLEGNSVRLGSVSIEKTDVLRRTVIGIAPLAIGLSVVFFCLWWIISLPHPLWWQLMAGGVFIFEVCNTMFPSKADVAGSVRLLLILLLLLVAIVVLAGGGGEALLLFGSQEFFRTGVYYFSIIIAVDILALAILLVSSRL